MEAKTDQQGQNDTVVDHELQGVTPAMIDWWWVNMEKGYQLWEPDEHKSFVWEVPPPLHTHVGAIQIVEESIGGGPIRRLRIRWEDASASPIPIIYEHALLLSGLDPDNNPLRHILHQYEATSYGTRMRSTLRYLTPMPPGSGDAWVRHNKSEVGRFADFLPQLYNMWQVVRDPTINRQCSLKLKRS
jgi:hypothetical protein